MKNRKKNGAANNQSSPPKSVKGLANIAALVVPVATAAAPQVEKPKVMNTETIINKTISALSPHMKITDDAVRKVVAAAVREALNLGHALAVGQNDMIEDLLKKQYKARTDLTMPAVVAAVMEQSGMTELMLNLDDLANVFTRCRIEQELMDDMGQPNTMRYLLRHLTDDSEGAGDNSFALAP